MSIVKKDQRLTLRPDHCTHIIEIVVNKCLDFLTKCISELHYLGQIQSIFEGIRKNVDLKISELGKGVKQEIQSIYTNLISQNPSDKMKVADSCRRILISIADRFFPPKDEKHKLKDGTELEVKNNQFINRLICFFDSKDSNLTSSECHYLSNLNKKIVGDIHKKELSQEEVSMIALHTYLIVHEALKYLK